MKAHNNPKTLKPDKPKADEASERVLAIVEQLPEAQAITHGEHLSLEVRKKRFGWFLADHHGDGRIAINCKASDTGRDEITREMPNHAHLTKYVGHHGWIGIWLDSPNIKWPLVQAALTEAYRMSAPKTLAAKIGT